MKTEKELTPELKHELKLIMEDNYARGAFCGMATNLYFDSIQSANPFGADLIIEQALMIRLLAKRMAGLIPEPKEQTPDEVLLDNVPEKKPEFKLVM
jgi:hypothetical protein